MRKSKFLICMLLVLALVIAIPAAIFANDSASDTGNAPEYGGNIYNAGTVNIAGGSVSGGVARYGGNIYNASSGKLSVLDGAIISGGLAGIGNNIFAHVNSLLNFASGTVLGDESGNIGVNMSGTHVSCICGNTNNHAEGCNGNTSIKWTAWTDPTSLPTEPGYYYLTGDVYAKESTTLTGNGDYYLDLNGKTIYSQVGYVYNVNSSTTNSLTILDSAGNGSIQLGSSTDVGAFARVAKNNVLTIYGGTINGEKVSTKSTAGAIIALGASNQGGTLNIHGGKIIGGTATGAKGSGTISVNSGTLNITGGEICGGKSALGGNIYVYAGATANISGANTKIHSGTANADGYADAGNVYAEEGAILNISDDVDISNSLVQQTSSLKVGYGIAEITPKENWKVATGGNDTIIMDKNAINPIYAVSVYMVDSQGNEYLNVVFDLSTAGLADNRDNGLGIGDQVRDIALEQFGLDAEHVTVAGTHAHASVKYGNGDEVTNAWRQNELRNGVIASIQQAKNDVSPVTGMYTGSTETEKMTFVRRYTTSSPNYTNGYYDGFKQNESGVPNDLAHEEADEEIQLIKIVRETGKDIVMVNWQTHATLTDNLAIISSDFIGSLRETVASGLNAHCVFYQGACGNLAPTSLIKNESKYKASLASALQLGEDVAAYVVGFNDYTEVKTGGIQVNQQLITNSPSSKVTDPTLIAVANEVYDYGKNHDVVTTNQYIIDKNYDDTYGLESYQHAKEIVEVRSGSIPTNKEYEINAVSIGDVAFITLPMELSDVTGKQLKDCSDFDTVMLIGYSCGKGKYVMHDAAYDQGGYETYCTYFQRGEAEKLVGLYGAVLDELYTTRY